LLRSLYNLGLVFVCATSMAASDWTRTRSPHFEVYAQPDANAGQILRWFERLRSLFVERTGVTLDGRSPMRVIAFRSPRDYEPYRIRPTADAYFAAADSGDYIVMVVSSDADFQVAAHEYWHYIEHVAGMNLPPWLNEGLGEVFSGSVPANKLRIVRTRPWIPLSQLLDLPPDSPLRDASGTAQMFYSESWALADLLTGSSDYSPDFPRLLAAFSSGASSEGALERVYHKSMPAVETDLRDWIARRKLTPPPPMLPGPQIDAAVTNIPEDAVRLVIAELLLATNRMEQADSLFRHLRVPGPLAAMALRRGDRETARRKWAQALADGHDDAVLCFRYAMLAEEAGFPPEDIRPALERAVALRPGFDDALFRLALVDQELTDYQASLTHLQAVRSVAPGRRYAYWIAMTRALGELGRVDEAHAAAQKAREFARTDDDRGHATQVGVLAVTDSVVQVTRDEDGNVRVVPRRVRHGAAWNPFIEPSDRVRRVEGVLREIDCGGSASLFVVEAGESTLTLRVPDPLRVQMRQAPPEFTCGPQPMNRVLAEYAETGVDAGVLRGLEFR
jgi:tetratricopeptide (TPR) repeat protein